MKNPTSFIMASLLMSPSDRSHGKAKTRKRTTKRKTAEQTIAATPDSEDYRASRDDIDWDEFQATVSAYLTKNVDTSTHVGSLVTAIMADFDGGNSQAAEANADAADVDGDDFDDDDPLSAILGADPFALVASGVRVLPSDPDMATALRTIADALDAAWMEQTKKTAAEQKNATAYQQGDSAK